MGLLCIQTYASLFFMKQNEREKRWAEAVAATLRAERAVAGLSQAETAERANIARTSYRLYEEGKRNPNVPQLVSIAATFKIPFSSLIGDIERRAGG